MTAPTENDRVTLLSPSAGATTLAWDFHLTREDALAVVRTRDGVETTLTLGVDYAFPSGLGTAAGGSLTLAGAASPTVAGDAYALVGDQPIVRQSDFSPSNAFDTVKQNADLDYLTRTQQELARDLGRAPKVAFGRAGPALPVPAAGKLLRWDKDGANAIENADLESDLLNQAIQAAEEVTGTIPPLTFLSVASLRAFNNETVATAVDVIGWHSATRVGGGRFALDASEGATADDGG
ncbi:MAG: hypothetical protein ABJJ73_12030, partial [Nitratireductor sp.]